MAADAQIERLSRQLSMQGLGPLDPILNEAIVRLNCAAAAVAAWLRRTAYDQPLTTLLLACQFGYLIARIGRRYARR